MKRIISKNPHRTEENKDLFDYRSGKFIVRLWRNDNECHELFFPYFGKNMQESIKNRNKALGTAMTYRHDLLPFFMDVTISEVEDEL